MAKLIKYRRLLAINFCLLTTFTITNCATKPLHTTAIEATNIPLDPKFEENVEILNFIAPYKNNVDTDMGKVLTYSTVVYDKAIGKWQTNIGDLFATFIQELGNPIYESRTGNSIDMCLLNNGGLRAVIPQGEIRTRNAFEVMPFENSLYVAELKGETIYKMVDFLLYDKKPHPLHDIQIIVDQATNKPKSIKIKGQEVQKDKIYHVATNDYLVNGGDYMSFFNDAVKKHDLDYKMRNMTIDYFNKVDTLPVVKQLIYIFE
jgi:2',3'-cyclic-nucleotide 2'-phosphodiesterase (5'-nucleotidase family)